MLQSSVSGMMKVKLVTGYIRSLGSADRFFNLINKVKDTRMSKYVFATDCIIEPNTMPKYEYQKNLILNRTWPIKIGIRTCLKKDEI